jgi:hypothetical protein
MTRLTIGQVVVGPITVGQLVLRNAALGISAGQAQLQGVVITVRLRFDLEWHVHIGLPWPFDDIDIGDTTFLGTISIPFAFGNAAIPNLQNINLNIAQLTGSNIATQADPIANVKLDGLRAEDIRASGITAPVQGFTLSGMSLGSLAVQGIGVPAASVTSATVGRVHGQPASLPLLVLKGLSLPAAAANDISSGALDIPITRDAITLGADLGLLRIGLKVTPSANMHVDRMLMSGVQARASVGTIELRNVTLPYNALNITLADMGIETLEIPTIGVN